MVWGEFVAMDALLGGGQGSYYSFGNLGVEFHQLWVEWGWDGDGTSEDAWIGL